MEAVFGNQFQRGTHDFFTFVTFRHFWHLLRLGMNVHSFYDKVNESSTKIFYLQLGEQNKTGRITRVGKSLSVNVTASSGQETGTAHPVWH